MAQSNIHWHIEDSPEAVTRAVLARLKAAAEEAIAARGRFVVALSGGNTPKAVYRALGADESVDLSRWILLYADDRCLPVGDPERNDVAVLDSGMAERAGAHLPMPAQLGPEKAAQAYALMIAPFLPLDVAYLGVGPDGHTASLFPEHDLDPVATVVAVHDSPKPPPERVSLGLSTLTDARQRIVELVGASKRGLVDRWHGGESLPIGLACMNGADVYLDHDAGRGLGDRISANVPSREA
ncbi:MAG: 6-phosphogluconolactonase [Gammaproteobacteria bacterium]|nr:6-phosphogluconolactonase [Gammaproteobacteria bacterium]MCP5137798.1 6-phosphogluconolactonase [Gammaproteobacteria bacterium]